MDFVYLCIHDKDIVFSLSSHGMYCHSFATDIEFYIQKEQNAFKTFGFYGRINVALYCPFHLLQQPS